MKAVITKCPDDYPYLGSNENDGKCKKKCGSGSDYGYYIEQNGIKTCTEVSGTLYIIEENENSPKKYSDYCYNGYNNGIPNYTYYIGKKCVNSCVGQGDNTFSFKAINKPQECLTGCPQNGENEAPYYYENDHFCLKKCDKFYDSTNDKICVEKCNDGEFILPDNKCAQGTEQKPNPCPKEAPFYYIFNDNKNGATISLRKCIINCNIIEGYSYFNSNGECSKTLSSGQKSIYGLIKEANCNPYKGNSNGICSKC